MGKMLSRTEELQGGVDREWRRRWQIHPHEDRHCNPLPRSPHGPPWPVSSWPSVTPRPTTAACRPGSPPCRASTAGGIIGPVPDLCVKVEEAPRLRLGCLGDLLFLEE